MTFTIARQEMNFTGHPVKAMTINSQLQRGLFGALVAARRGLLGAYFSRELQRMPPMDVADVYYDRLLLAADVSSKAPLATDGMSPERPGPPYDKLCALQPTAFDSSKPVREIRLTLDGDMERYVWFLNNQPLSEADDIEIIRGEVVRFIVNNRTMMHHPMHQHGHFGNIGKSARVTATCWPSTFP